MVCSTARLAGLIGCGLGMLSASFEEGDCHALAEPVQSGGAGLMATAVECLKRLRDGGAAARVDGRMMASQC